MLPCSTGPPGRWQPRPWRSPLRLGRSPQPPPPAGAQRARQGSSRAQRQNRWGAICGRSRDDGITSIINRKSKASSNRSRPPRLLWVSPVDAGQQVAELRRRDRHHAVGRARPQEAALLQALGEQACPLAVMPDHLQQVAATAAEAKQMAVQRVAMQNLLDLQGQRRNGGVVREVAWVSQMITIVSRPVFLCSHRRLAPTNQTASFETQMIPMTPQVLRRTLKADPNTLTSITVSIATLSLAAQGIHLTLKAASTGRLIPSKISVFSHVTSSS